ncbi:MAG: hypothetical protein ACI89J_002525 [Hyphomicrobiaceae bacterium]|jgi:hypothetical protein
MRHALGTDEVAVLRNGDIGSQRMLIFIEVPSGSNKSRSSNCRTRGGCNAVQDG